jgi:hypothetical protein
VRQYRASWSGPDIFFADRSRADYITSMSGLDLRQALLVQRLNLQKRYHYATSAVVPLGLVLSLIAVYTTLFTGWKDEE